MFMLRVLLVDDRRDFRRAFKERLSYHYPSAFIEDAGGSDEALEKVKGGAPHLIFMDIRMPGMNGLQLTQRIKKERPETRIAILTSYDLPEYREAALRLGADHFFVKSSLQWDEVVTFVKSIPTENKF
jgi:YesN/AraC family two-component response regulator